MQEICDVYVVNKTKGSSLCLRLLPIVIEGAVISADTTYQGFLNLQVKRIKAVSVVQCLRGQRIRSFSAPIRYRDNPTLSYAQALEIAENSIRDSGFKISECLVEVDCPVYWGFPVGKDYGEERAGSRYLHVDKLDGHLWESEDITEYNYDYNNLI